MSDDSPQAELRDLTRRLEALVEDRARLASLDPDLRRRLLTAAGRLSRPRRDEDRALARAFRRRDRDALTAAEEAALARTGIRHAGRAPVYPTPPPALPSGEPLARPDATAPGDAPRLRAARKCYVCKAPFVEVHAFYDQMCP